jgi:mRNA interferase MazF
VASAVARGDVRLYQVASPDKNSPVVVLTRDSAVAYLSTVSVAPVTSAIRGVPSEVVLNEEDGLKTPCAVNLHNVVTISQHRLGKRVARLGSSRISGICAALRFSLGRDLIQCIVAVRPKNTAQPTYSVNGRKYAVDARIGGAQLLLGLIMQSSVYAISPR